jgi:hypothetical protein
MGFHPKDLQTIPRMQAGAQIYLADNESILIETPESRSGLIMSWITACAHLLHRAW